MNKIINLLKEQKSIPLDKFIDLALYDKKFGYYTKKNPFGDKGDFITSPLISNLFGEMIAIWCISYWEYLRKPKKILIVELGPGDGSLCENLLNTFKKFHKFYNSVEINLLEVSNKLKVIQKNKLKNNNMFFEKHVTLSNNNKKVEFLYKKANQNLIKNLEKLNLISGGSIIEYPVEAIKYLEKIIKKIKKFDGGLLTFDYGYIEEKNFDTLQSIKKHQYTNPLLEPGKSDITSHINFKLFDRILKKNNLEVKKIITQSEFLKKMGIIERASILSKKMTFKEKANMFFRLKRLLDHKEMGNLFKVLFAQKKKNKFSLGF